MFPFEPDRQVVAHQRRANGQTELLVDRFLSDFDDHVRKVYRFGVLFLDAQMCQPGSVPDAELDRRVTLKRRFAALEALDDRAFGAISHEHGIAGYRRHRLVVPDK